MPFQLVARGDDDRPVWLLDEEVFCCQPLAYLFSGADVRADAEGRGTLYITSHRVLFLSDEDRDKNLSWQYEDFTAHGLSLSRSSWPHACLTCRIAQHDDGDDDASAPRTGMWIRRKMHRGQFDDAEDEEEAAAEDSGAAPAVPPAAGVWEEQVVQELRFVAPKGEEQLKAMYAAWNKGDDLNVEAESEEEAEPEAKASDASKRGALLNRLDRMLIVPPVNRGPAAAPSAAAVASATSAAAVSFDDSDSAIAVPAVSESCASCLPPATLRACSTCVRDRPECHYSSAQLKKKGKRVCRTCIARKEGTAEPALHEPAAPGAATPHASAATVATPIAPVVVSAVAPAATSSAASPSPALASAPALSGAAARAAMFAKIMAGAGKNLADLEVETKKSMENGAALAAAAPAADAHAI